jgi:8-oxo-dGTP pyrophosphatase MutT (NUDIX family)
VTRRKATEETSAGGVLFRRTATGPVFLLIRDSYRNWGFPKGHLESGEEAAAAAVREIAEETGLTDLVLHGSIREIDWHFRFRGRLIHKTCTFFLFESPTGEAVPQADEGISACRWMPFDEALRTVSYANAREVLREAGTLVSQLAGT